MSWLTDPLAYAFFARAVVIGALVGAMCGAVGVFVVLRRMSYIGHGLAHSVLGGVAVALTFDLGIYWGAGAAAVVSAVLIDRISRQPGIYADAAIGIVTTALFAAGVVAISVGRTVRYNLEGLLFGSILGIATADLVLALVVAAILVALLFVLYKPLVFVTFDPVVAAAHGVQVGRMELLFHLLVAAVVVASVRVLGVLLIAAAVVVPAALARLVTASFGKLLAVATGAGAAVTVAGLYVSFHLDAPSGATVVLTGVAAFGLTAAVTTLAHRLRLHRGGVSLPR